MYEFEKIAGVRPSVNYLRNPKYKFEKIAAGGLTLGTSGTIYGNNTPNGNAVPKMLPKSTTKVNRSMNPYARVGIGGRKIDFTEPPINLWGDLDPNHYVLNYLNDYTRMHDLHGAGYNGGIAGTFGPQIFENNSPGYDFGALPYGAYSPKSGFSFEGHYAQAAQPHQMFRVNPAVQNMWNAIDAQQAFDYAHYANNPQVQARVNANYDLLKRQLNQNAIQAGYLPYKMKPQLPSGYDPTKNPLHNASEQELASVLFGDRNDPRVQAQRPNAWNALASRYDDMGTMLQALPDLQRQYGPMTASTLPQIQQQAQDVSHANFGAIAIPNNNQKGTASMTPKQPGLYTFDSRFENPDAQKSTYMYDVSEDNLARQANRQDRRYGGVTPGSVAEWGLMAEDAGMPLGNYEKSVIKEYNDQHWADKYLQQQAAEENYRRQAQAQADRRYAEKAVAKYDKNLTADQWMAMNPLQRGNVINQYNRDQYAARNKKMQEDTTWADMDKGIDPMTGKFVNRQAEEGYNNAVNNYNDIRQRYINKERSLWENRWRANGRSDTDIDKYLNSEADKYMANHGLTDPRKAVYEHYKDNLNYTPSSPFAEGAWKQSSSPATSSNVKSPKAPPVAKAPATLAPRYTRPSAPAVPSSPSLEPSMPSGIIGDAFKDEPAPWETSPAAPAVTTPMPPIETDPFLEQ